MSNSTKKPGKGFWIIGIVALIWNLMGVFAYLQDAYMSAEDLAALPAEQQALLENVPAWVTGAYAIAVFGGALACILLLMRKKLATIIFLVSLIGIIVQMSYYVFMSEALEIYGSFGMVMTVMVLVIGIFLWQYSKKQESIGILS